MPGSGHIEIRGARVHNLRDVDADIPLDVLVVLTGVSGSGKSSLAFDTLFAEGQRRYLESLSTYTRQFLEQMERPDVDRIEGLPPTLSIEQRVGSVQVRSTLGTTTEIYDFLRLLYARAGQVHCPQCGGPIMQQSRQTIVDQILALEERRKVMILAPLVRGRKGMHREVFERIAKEGFVRARVDGEIVDAADPPKLAKSKPHDIDAIVDRIVVKEGIRPRIEESVDLALKHGGGACLISYEADGAWHDRLYSSRFACPKCEVSFPDLEPRTFSFNSPYGACTTCEGLGEMTASNADSFSRVPPGRAATTTQATTSEPSAVCPDCAGTRLGPLGRSVTLAGRTIGQYTGLSIAEAAAFTGELVSGLDANPSFTEEGRLAARRILPGIAVRFQFLLKVGLDYLTLDRPTRTLSGGEFQRARLAACLGSGLIGVCYVLDEPTIGLHPRDTARLVKTLEELRDQGNTVLVVEHDLDVIRRADHVIDLGPGAGTEGGRVIAAGTPEDLEHNAESITGRYLAASHALAAAPPLTKGGPGGVLQLTQVDDDSITPPAPPSQGGEPDGSLREQHEQSERRERRSIDWQRSLTLAGATLHNLRNLTVRVPLGVLTCVTGVSGSGKSSLFVQTFTPALQEALGQAGSEPGPFARLEGVEQIDRVIEIDQSPIGRTGRSNPATYSGAWNEIRKVLAHAREARLRGYSSRRFSFNSMEGRCDECRGQGTIRLKMQFLPDMQVTCPRCKGARFNRQTLAIRYRGRNAADILASRVDEAAEFFASFPRLHSSLQTFVDVGLGYLTLGQSALTLSGGEAQRVKLAAELSRADGDKRTLFILDEPTTGLHPADIERLLHLLCRLVEAGNTVVVIEHQLDVIAAADWVIDLGPEGGAGGGEIVAEGRPEEIARVEHSHTGRALRMLR